MKFKNQILSILFVFAFCLISVAQTENLPAFPSAEGGGKYTTGGRGGQVYYVTSLEDNGTAGTLRVGVENLSGPRIIMFKVSGTIKLKSQLKISRPNITIAGQTAPGDGICIRDYSVVVETDNVIIRYLRFRLGDETNQQNDAIWGRENKNIILDHCSMSWSTDECASFYDNENFTMQWCLLAESLRISVHDKGKHGYGGIWGGKKASFHHNLFAHHDSRNPRFNGSRYSNQPELEKVDYRNNVIYNWGGNSAYAGEGGSYNIINNYYKAGPATPSSKADRIMQPYPDNGGNNQPAGVYGTFYVDGNYITANSQTTNNNWLGIDPHSSFSDYGVSKDDLKSDTAYQIAPCITQDAEKAYEKVLQYVGASLVRDTVDSRIVYDVETGTATVMDGGNGSSNGLIDTQSAVGGWPVLNSTEAPTDTDNDGMPNTWEDSNGLNKTDAGDAKLTTVDGKYPNLEVYLNSLVSNISNDQYEGGVFSKPTASIEINRSDSNLELLYDQSTGTLQISHENKITKVEIYSIAGQLILSYQPEGKEVNIQLPTVRNDIYITRIQDEKKQNYSAKFISTK
ncbi:T9SS type A sorting domain-containing protein [uncultured Sunxiuqinia sp.]|uniref:T9SS type A sorting domain-containing protein n=1 Tax=uncultured Sunxiuqinia sp. TaxID=1573825 RepID=UPI002AA63CB1|nr:T9SS type A sorting domain-containing protein [uncultured Sunxiuqinia sp.]